VLNESIRYTAVSNFIT